jgi:hypothetical protein
MVISYVLLLAASSPPDYFTPDEKRGQVVAWVETRGLSPRADAPGLAEGTLQVQVEGPETLEVRDARLLNDGLWEVIASSGMRDRDGKRHWQKTFAITQKNPGRTALPGVEVTFREGPAAEWDTISWPDLLKEPQVTKLIDVQIKTPTVPRWPLWTAFGATLALLVAMTLWKVLRTRRPTTVPPTAAELAERELAAAAALADTDSGAAHERSADAVRRLFAHRFQLPAMRRTTAEFLDALQREASLPADSLVWLRMLLERCDLVKFAGLRPSREETIEMIELARSACAMATASANPAAATTTPAR